MTEMTTKAALIIDEGYLYKSLKLDPLKIPELISIIEAKLKVKLIIGKRHIFTSNEDTDFHIAWSINQVLCRRGSEVCALKSRTFHGDCVLVATNEKGEHLAGKGSCSTKIQSGVDVAIGVQMTVYAFDKDIESVVFLTGDGDFEEGNALKILVEKQKTIFIVGFKNSISSKLQAYCQVLYLDDFCSNLQSQVSNKNKDNVNNKSNTKNNSTFNTDSSSSNKISNKESKTNTVSSINNNNNIKNNSPDKIVGKVSKINIASSNPYIAKSLKFNNRFVAIYSPSNSRMLQMTNNGEVTISSEDCLPTNLTNQTLERFKIIDAGSGEAAFYNTLQKRFLRMEMDGTVNGYKQKEENQLDPGSGFERFKLLVVPGEGIAIHSTFFNRFLKISKNNCVGGSEECDIEMFSLLVVDDRASAIFSFPEHPI
jgi:uncharacterized LabA/DUF88 family protein